MNVVIAGGGFCGSVVAKKLEKIKNIKVVLIDQKEYFEYKPGIPKMIRNKKNANDLKIEYKEFLKNTSLIFEKIKKINPKKIETENNTYKYDLLVISYGVKYPIFLKNKENVFTITAIDETLKALKKLRKSEKILIIGGGLLGVETAAEIATQKNKKKIIIVHSKDRLIKRNPTYASYIAKKFLEKNNVEIIFKEKIKENKNGEYLTDKNRIMSADICFWSAGIKCDTSFMEDFDKSIFTGNGCLKVDKYLRLKGYDNIFVGGDITDIKEEKTAQNSEHHAKTIVKNINRILLDKKPKKYKKKIGPLLISLGSKKGILVFREICFYGFIPAFLKEFVELWFFKKL